MKKDSDLSIENSINIALNFIKYRPRTKKEIFDKLKTKGFSLNIINEAIKYLEKNEIIDDRLFAREWFKERLFSKMLGKKKVILELKKKGIADEIINETLAELSDSLDEKENALNFLRNKFAKPSPSEKINKEKLIRILLSRGYSYGISEIAAIEFLNEKFPGPQ